MKKALMHAHTAYMLRQFNMDNVKTLQSLGYEVHISTCFGDDDSALSQEVLAAYKKQLDDDGFYVIETASLRKITAIGELLKAYKKLKSEINKNQYEIIHTQSPIGGVICRLAARGARKKYGTKVIYAAHGFHFFKGAPKKNWLIYCNAEKFCAKFTDLIITINNEDYKSAREILKAKEVKYIHGAGIDTEKFLENIDCRDEVRKELGLTDNDIAIVSLGELIPRKNHKTMIDAMSIIKEKNLDKNYKYFIVGRGAIKNELEDYIKEKGLEDSVIMLGFRKDVPRIMSAFDICAFPSFQEGLPVGLMEAMAAGLACVASDIRGNEDLLKDGGGKLVPPSDAKAFAEGLLEISADAGKLGEMKKRNIAFIKSFDKKVVNQEMKEIYEEIREK